MFNFIKQEYDAGVFNKTNLQGFVQKGWLTVEQYQEITGEAYPI